ncbi:hypothetical protein D1007_43076 [Hordeum vulgare]|nr:hypothetical protein D1007_43076 [Hordeum vulgare]
MDLNLLAEEEEEAQHDDPIDLNLLAEEEDEAQHDDPIDLNLLAEEEDEARHDDPIDLNLMAEEDDEARHGDLIDLNLLAEEEDEAQHGDLIDLNLLAEEEDEAQHGGPIDLNLLDEDEQDQQDADNKEAQVADEEEAQAVQEEEAQVVQEEEPQHSDAQLQRIWTNAKRQLDSGQEVDISNKKKGNSGRKRKQLDLSRTATIPQSQKKNDPISCKVPSLKPANKIVRLEFCISMMDQKWISNPWPSFKSMNNMVHIDEKWYDMTRVKNSYYVVPREPEPERTVSNTNSIGKVMFLTAVPKPRYSDEGEMTFDGKIGTWAFVVETEAQRTSQNRDRGTMELKSLKVTRPVCRDYLINKVIPAIQDKWPDDDDGTIIFIQQDNPRPHVPPNDPEFREAVEETDLDIRLLQQPPNSPEFNVLDLCFHCSLQSLTNCRAPMNIRELVQGVEEEFQNYGAHKLFKSFITLQAVMVEIMKDQGGNSTKIVYKMEGRK